MLARDGGMVEPSAGQTTGHRAGGRPPAIVSIGVTGHRRIAGGAASAAAVAVELGRTIDSLKAAADRQLGAEGIGGETQLRLVTMLAQGADLLAASQATQRAVPVAAILPGTVKAFRATFDRSGSVRKLDKQLSAVRWLCELPCQVVDDIAFERANALILAQSDVLVAVWDGKLARGRAGTGDVVQAALNLGIPILVVDPAGKKETALIPASDALLLPRRATEFPRFAARLAFAPIVAPIVSPPRRTDQRSALQDFLAEPVEPRTRRFEHKLLTLLGGTIEAAGADGGAEAGPAGRSPMGDHDPARRIDKEFQHADRLANHYGQLMRSTQVSRFFLIALAACLNAAVSLLLPAFQPASTVIQMVITIVSLFDDRWARRRRWHERWLDYRSMAERLRCLRYLQPLGLGDDIFRPSKRGRPQHWSDWYLARLVRELGPPAGHLQESEIRERLAFVHHEIGDQISYHRRALKRFCTP
jgi:hypothetical protein